jgi:hypothetical protein
LGVWKPFERPSEGISSSVSYDWGSYHNRSNHVVIYVDLHEIFPQKVVKSDSKWPARRYTQGHDSQPPALAQHAVHPNDTRPVRLHGNRASHLRDLVCDDTNPGCPNPDHQLPVALANLVFFSGRTLAAD